MKLSIIIPVYNIREYIVQCIESCICEESLSQYEIILVDDGSKDDSIELSYPYLKKYDNISVVKRKNGGLSAARNSGLDIAKGEYVWFVDGDDYIEKSAITKILHAIDKYKCDFFIMGYNSVLDGVKIKSNIFNLRDGIINTHEEFLRCNFSFPMLVWTHVYKTEFLKENSLKFYEGIIHEDIEFKFCSHYLAKSVFEIKEPLYNYRIARENSIMANTSKNPQRSIDSNHLIMLKFLEDSKRLNIPLNVRNQYLSDISLLALERIYDQKNSIIKKNKDKIQLLTKNITKSKQLKRKLFAYICLIFPDFMVRYFMHFYQRNR